MDDENTNEENERSALEVMGEKLTAAIEGVRTESRDQAIKAVSEFAEKIESQRSRTAPVQKKSDSRSDEDLAEQNRSRAITVMDGREPLYRRMEQGRSNAEVSDFRASRNPRMDELTAQWVRACDQRNVGERIRLHDEMNDRYAKELGFSRASLLSGDPNADSGFGDGTGAELLPLPLAGQLILERDKASKMRALVNTFPMSTQTQRIPVLPTVTATSRAENASYIDNTPNPDSALLNAVDIGVMFSAGRNFLEDTGFNIANQLTVVAGGAIGAEEDVQICTSTGNAADITEGLDAATITDIAETTASNIGWEDFVSLYYGLPEQYRRNAKFFATSTTLADVMSIVDGNGRPVFTPISDVIRAINDIDTDAVGSILGKPVYEVPLADDSIYFGDPMWYALGNRTGIRVDTDRAVTTGNRQWVIDERIDGRVIPTSAVGTNNAWRKVVY